MNQRYYFVGAGGIGMAGLERYFMAKGHEVAGYDRTPSNLTDALQAEGVWIVFEDDPALIPEGFRDPAATTVVYTPAIPTDNRILTYFRNGGFRVVKRAVVLGDITRRERSICIAGSHGKTTTCSMTAWILAQTPGGCNAFLGGVLKNTGSNFMLSDGTDLAVAEADEYDRSFHQLRPWIAAVTSTDPDHLDIYGDEEHYLEAFSKFSSLVAPGGRLIVHTGLKFRPTPREGVETVTYSGADLQNPGDWHATGVRFTPGELHFDVEGPEVAIRDISLGVPVEINIDNAVCAAACAWYAGATPGEIRRGLESFRGARRRFDIWLREGEEGSSTVLLDDYAHSPAEVAASIRSIRKLYPGKRVTVIFQPHLYTRTRDFAPDFARALSGADEAILTEIYPAREEPIPGVDTQLIMRDITTHKIYCERKNLLKLIKNSNFDILITLGAADLDRLLPEIKRILTHKDGEKDREMGNPGGTADVFGADGSVGSR